jgi:hypothetical protein
VTFRLRYLVLVALGGAFADTYTRALRDYSDGEPGWLTFVAIWLPAAILLGLLVVFIGPAIYWRLRGAQAAASAGRQRSIFGVGGSFYTWVAPFSLALTGGALLAREDWLPGAILAALALLIGWLGGRAARAQDAT